MARVKAKNLVRRAKLASGNERYQLDRMPKGHWMRKDQAKKIRKERNFNLKKYSGIKNWSNV